ncbi:tyrosine-type recombinase/integrase [Saccharicrinis sp. FJH54]|uniref:tyrosine-type recombinase/integrase n=1 Tax=Saccharicrinis sp. FJH54 TaxID=3344665 RepID=UPI0035D50D63
MSKKFSNTTADYLSWDQNINLIHRLYTDGNYKFSLLIALGSFWGLRISDILKLKWDNILDKTEIVIKEKKTGKNREIKINNKLQLHIKSCQEKIKPSRNEDFIFLSQKGTVYSVQRINVIFKSIKRKYNLKIGNFSTHSLRKTFGRKIFESTDKSQSEMALAKLSIIFNHSSVTITRRYLGITKKEIQETYDLLNF